MDPNNDIEELQDAACADSGGGDAVSVDDFIKQLEAKEKDLHISADASIIEIEEAFDEIEIPDDFRPILDRPTKSIEIAPVQTGTAGGAPLRQLEAEVQTLKSTIAAMEADREELYASSERRARDFENLRARSERERQETFQNQIANLATLMLPALDNLHRALDSAEDMAEGKSPAFQQFFEGIVLVNEQITDILDKMGIRPILSVGEEFDPYYHEAVATEETDAHPPNTVCGELLRGYVAGERVIRHSLVKVAKAPFAASIAETPTGAADDIANWLDDPLSLPED